MLTYFVINALSGNLLPMITIVVRAQTVYNNKVLYSLPTLSHLLFYGFENNDQEQTDKISKDSRGR